MGSFDRQVGGDHYKKYAVQPAEYNIRNNIPWAEGDVISYVTRWRDKGGVADLEKAIHILQLLIECERRREKDALDKSRRLGELMGGPAFEQQASTSGVSQCHTNIGKDYTGDA